MPPVVVSLGERVASLEATVAEGSKSICSKYQDVKEDIAELRAESAAMREDIAEIKELMHRKDGMDTALSWVGKIVQFVTGGLVLWGLQHLPFGSGHN